MRRRKNIFQATYSALVAVVVFASFSASADDEKAKPKAPPVVPKQITVQTTDDPAVLSVRWNWAGKPVRAQVGFNKSVKEFRYCDWIQPDGQGIALVAELENNQFWYTVFPLGSTPMSEPRLTTKIPVPKGGSKLLGISNSAGDQLVISAVHHTRPSTKQNTYGEDQLTGWMFIDNCAPWGGLGGGILIPFKLPSVPAKIHGSNARPK